MSETHVWPPRIVVDGIQAECQRFLDRLRGLAGEYEADDPRRELLIAEAMAFADFQDRIRRTLTEPMPAVERVQVIGPREPGQDTLAWLTGSASMRRNRGPM